MAYSFQKSIVFDHTKVGTVSNTDQTNFPAGIIGTYSYLATAANGGAIQNTTTLLGQTVPADLIFTSDAAGTILLNWEVDFYNPVTGQIVVWIEIPTLSHSVNTTIYMFYGNAAVTTYQCTASSTWDSNFTGVYHLGDTSLSLSDSTSKANTLTNGGATTSGTGLFGGAASFNGTNQNLTTSSTSLIPGTTTAYTVSAWANPASNSSGAHNIFSNGVVASGGWSLQLRRDASAYSFYQNNSSLVFSEATSAGSVSVGSYTHVVATWDGSNIRLYINGVIQQTVAITTRGRATGTPTNSFGNDAPDGSIQYWDGLLDELRVSGTIARSADWIITEYNNQNSPTTFYTIGSSGGPISYVLNPVAGSYSITGHTTTLSHGYNGLGPVAGSYGITGRAATLSRAGSISAVTGSYAINGQVATLNIGHISSPNTGIYRIAGQAATLNDSSTPAILEVLYMDFNDLFNYIA